MASTALRADSACANPTSRRRIIKGLCLGMAFPPISVPAWASSRPDAKILNAWARHRAAFILTATTSDEDDNAPLDLMSEMEMIILRTEAKSWRGAAAKLWIVVIHSYIGRDFERAIVAGDYAALEGLQADLDFPERMTLNAVMNMERAGGFRLLEVGGHA
jgi:hypothetical protein